MRHSAPLRWALISGEYPPAAGGVAGYTAQVAAALAAAGDEVHVFAPAPDGSAGGAPGVVCHALPGQFRRRGRRRLEAELKAMAAAPRLLIQYVPHAYGLKGMNLGFCRWVGRQREPWIMYHEVAYPREAGQSARHRVLALVTRWMAGQLRRAAARSFVSTPAWETWLEEIAPGTRPGIWLPVPSNLPVRAEPAVVAAARRELAAEGGAVIGHFGRFGSYARNCLVRLLPELLAGDERRTALLAGPGGEETRREIADRHPALRRRLHAPGFLPPAAAAAHLAATDLLIQPYPDGICGRRGTAMAGLALGRPLLTTAGRFTEPVWRSSGAVALAPATEEGEAQAEILLPLAEALLRDGNGRQSLGQAGGRLYESHFALEHTVRALREAAWEDGA